MRGYVRVQNLSRALDTPSVRVLRHLAPPRNLGLTLTPRSAPLRVAFPFSAIVGQEEMKRAILLTAVDPTIGGVLILGHRGTAKSTAVRALPALLPAMNVVRGCRCR